MTEFLRALLPPHRGWLWGEAIVVFTSVALCSAMWFDGMAEALPPPPLRGVPTTPLVDEARSAALQEAFGIQGGVTAAEAMSRITEEILTRGLTLESRERITGGDPGRPRHRIVLRGSAADELEILHALGVTTDPVRVLEFTWGPGRGPTERHLELLLEIAPGSAAVE